MSDVNEPQDEDTDRGTSLDQLRRKVLPLVDPEIARIMIDNAISTLDALVPDDPEYLALLRDWHVREAERLRDL
jgi:hypothetical protein